MLIYLLFLALIPGIVESQTTNMTLSTADGNQTFSPVNPDNVTLSLYRDTMNQIQDEQQSNQTSNIITEEDEKFQNQEMIYPFLHCQKELLVHFSYNLCGDVFEREMLSISPENWCVLESIIRPYNNLTICLELVSNVVKCYYPNPNIQDFFLHIHSQYFHNCSKEELLFVDAPHELVIALTLIPVSLIPLLVYLVVWKSKVHE